MAKINKSKIERVTERGKKITGCLPFSHHSIKVKIYRELVVTPTKEHRIILLFNIIEIFNKFKIFEYHRIQKCTNNSDLRKQDFLSE